MGLWTKFAGVVNVRPKGLGDQRYELFQLGSRKVVAGDPGEGFRYLALAYDPEPAPEIWRKRLGYYGLIARDGDFQFIQGLVLHLGNHGQLSYAPVPVMLSGSIPPGAALHVIDDQQAVVEGLGRNKSASLSFDEAGRLHLAGMVFRKQPMPQPNVKRRRRFYRGSQTEIVPNE